MISSLNLLRETPFAAALADNPILAVDIGARGGFEPDLLPLAFAVDGIGFEPEPEAFAALTGSGPWRSLRHLPIAVSGTGGTRPLYVTRDRQSTSLLEPDPQAIAEFDKPQFVTVDERLSVQTMTLSAALGSAGINRVDYLKIDIEGPELEVLAAAPELVSDMLAVKVEVMFVPVRHGQPRAADIDQFMCGAGFTLMDLVRPAHWRRDGYIIHPQIGSGRIPYSRGQLIHGDYLFFRRAATLTAPHQALRAAALAMAHGYFDHAGNLLRRADVVDWLAREYRLDVEAALRAASLRYGRRAWLDAAWRHLRGVLPFVRSFARAVRPAGR